MNLIKSSNEKDFHSLNYPSPQAKTETSSEIELALKRQKPVSDSLACLKDFCLHTTFHGFLNIIKSPFRIVWIVLFNACIIYCLLCKI